MKSIRKFLVLFIGLVALSIAGFLLIFNQGLIGGLMLAGMAALFCAVLFTAGIFGIFNGKVDFFKIRNTAEAVGVMLFAIILFAVISAVTVANSFVEYTIGETNLAHEEKLRLFASTILQVPAQKELLTEEQNGVTFHFIEENQNEIDKMDQLLQEQREELNAFLGTKDSGGLAIEFHEDYESMEDYAGMKDVSGFYNTLNRTIHLVPDDPQWESVLMHEYTHYQSHLFALENGLSLSHVPHWFEEGIAEYFADADSFWFDLEGLEIVDFRSLDALDDFDASATEEFDPYAQSYLAVETLVEDHGEKVILELLEAKSVNAFYASMEEKTGQTIEEFQEKFLAEMISEQQELEKTVDLLYSAMEGEQYAEARSHLETIGQVGDAYDLDAAYWTMSEGYLQHGQYEDALKLMTEKVEQGDAAFLVDDLLFMAEIQLLSDPGKALELAKRAQQEAESAGEMDYYVFEKLIPAYQKINSPNPTGGYKILLDEELVYNGTVLEDLEIQLKKDYPAKF